MSTQAPGYVTAINQVSAAFVTLYGLRGGSTMIAAGIGAALGKVGGKTATYALQSVLTDIFWNYIEPRTFQKIFMHSESSQQTKIMGAILTYTASCAVPYLFTKYVISYIDENTPYIGRLKKENATKPFEAFGVTVVPAIIGVNVLISKFLRDCRF